MRGPFLHLGVLMSAVTSFEAFLADGQMTRPRADTFGARKGQIPRRSARVRPLTPHEAEKLREDDAAMAARHRARKPTEYGPTITYLVQDEQGERQLIEGRLSELRRAFPDETERAERERAGIEGGMVPAGIVQIVGTPEVEAAAEAIKQARHTITSALVAGAIDIFLARELRQRRKEFGIQ